MATLEENIQQVTSYNQQLVEAHIPYFIWRDNVSLNIDGPPAYAVDAPPPTPSEIVAIFCAGIGNVDRRLLGLPIPKNSTYPGYNGGTLAWRQNYWENSKWFDLDQAAEGDIAFRPYQWSGDDDQGHWAYCTGGADAPLIQSYPNTWEGTIVEPGVNADLTLGECHANWKGGDYFVVLIKAESWISSE